MLSDLTEGTEYESCGQGTLGQAGKVEPMQYDGGQQDSATVLIPLWVSPLPTMGVGPLSHLSLTPLTH